MTATTGEPNAEPVAEAVAEPLVPEAPTTPATPGAAAPAHALARPSRRLKALAVLRWLVARSIAIVLFVTGVALGYSAYLATQAPPTPIVDAATAGVAAPAVVKEFIDALGSNDPGALRSAVPDAPYQLLTTEMSRWDFQRVTGVETLSTFVDGPRSATELILSGVSTSGSPIRVNLIVQVEDGQIESFR
jgi:hypothetical protein